jgi:hypothetical protein
MFILTYSSTDPDDDDVAQSYLKASERTFALKTKKGRRSSIPRASRSIALVPPVGAALAAAARGHTSGDRVGASALRFLFTSLAAAAGNGSLFE